MAQTPCLLHKTGDYADYTPGSGVLAGAVVVVGTLPLIAPVAIAANVKGVLALNGIFKVPQKAEIITAGDAVYWDASGNPYGGTASSGAATGATASVYIMGVAVLTTTATDTYVYVSLHSAKRTATIGGAVTASDIEAEDATLNINGLDAAQGGTVPIAGGTSGTSGNAGGAASIAGGVPGVTGAGGAASVTGGVGGTTSGTGGAASLTGGAATSAASNAIGGAAAVTGGIGKGNLAGGAGSLIGGVGGATGAGGAIAVTGGTGGSGSGTGGAVAIAGGAGSAGDADGGAVTILAGNANGSGTDGTMGIGTSNTSAITIGATSIATSLPGPLTPGIGASTAAAGTTTADDGNLPAATAMIYPTTAADDTTGVGIHADDKVTGRMLFIGNGVSNKILKVYPPSGGTINGANADAAFSSVTGKGVLIACLSSGSNTWLAM